MGLPDKAAKDLLSQDADKVHAAKKAIDKPNPNT